MILNLGCGGKIFADAVNVDIVYNKGVDLVCDLRQKWPFKDSSVEEVYADNVFEHLPDILHTMSELYRVLGFEGKATIIVPSTNGMGAFQDPTHVSFWNHNTFVYFLDREASEYLGFRGRFEVEELHEETFSLRMGGYTAFVPFVKAVLRKSIWPSISAI